MLELTDTRKGASTRHIVDSIWPANGGGGHQSKELQRLLAKTRNALVVHQRHGRVRQSGFAYGSYQNSRSIIWKITPKGRAWLNLNEPEKVAERRAATRAAAKDRTARRESCEQLIQEAKKEYGPGTAPPIRREVSRLLRAEGCTLQSIADIFDVTRELIRVDCLNLKESHKLSTEERFDILAARWLAETAFMSNLSLMVDHPAYQEIISMGKPAVPLMLKKLQERPDHWFYALVTVTGEDHAKGIYTVKEAAEAWVEWGLQEGLIS